MSACAEARTCVTVPGAESACSVHSVWIESTMSEGRRRFGAERGEDVLDAGLGGELHRRAGDAEPVGAEPDLRDGLLAGDIDDRRAAIGERAGDLEQQRRFADAGIAADQQRRAAHEPAAGDAVELGDAGNRARGVFGSRRQAR